MALSFKKYTAFFISRKGQNWRKCVCVRVCVCVWVWERDRERGNERHRLAEDCRIGLFLTNVVIPYSGPYVFASLKGSQPGLAVG